MALATALPPGLQAQGSGVLTASAAKTVVRRNSVADAKISVQLQNGYHVNSNTPGDEYLIPLRLRWEKAPLEAVQVVFPKPEKRKYDFSEKPLSVFTGDFQILVRFKVPATAPRGPGILIGKLRYQACNDTMCLPPRTAEVRLPYQIQ